MPIAIQAALLGIVQGLTEFLPVSSSAHLILARAFFGWDSDQFGLSFDVACHVGTLIAALIYFRREISAMVASLPRLFQPARDPEARVIWLLAIGTIPAIVAGLLFNERIEEHLRTPWHANRAGSRGDRVAGCGARRLENAPRRQPDHGGGLPARMRAGGRAAPRRLAIRGDDDRRAAPRAAPAGCGAVHLPARHSRIFAAAARGPRVLKAGLGGGQAALFLIGVVTSAIVGYAAVRFFIRYLVSHSLDAFAW